VSATQVVLLVLVVLAFVLGWVARGRREASDPLRGRDAAQAAEIDAALGASLTAFQAALAVWQQEGGSISPLGRRALATFDQSRAVAEGLCTDALGPPEGQAALARARASLDLLASGVADYEQGAPLHAERSLALLRAERALMAARGAFLLAVIGGATRTPSPAQDERGRRAH
jgi:hypothetical protein